MRPPASISPVVLASAALLLLWASPRAGASFLTFHDFDSPGTPFTFGGAVGGGGVLPDGPTGSFVRLVDGNARNGPLSITFDRTAEGAFPSVVADFDFRMTRLGGGADGLGFVLLPTAVFGTTGKGPDQVNRGFMAEEPNLPGTFGLGFDIHQRTGEPNNNHLSLHFDGRQVAAFADPGINLANGSFNHARVEIDQAAGGSLVSVTLTTGSVTATPVVNYFIAGFDPYESRVAFYARHGAEVAHHDLDNIRVSFSGDTTVPAPSGLALAGLGLLCLAARAGLCRVLKARR